MRPCFDPLALSLAAPYDARVFVGQVDLIVWLRTFDRGLGRLAPGLLARGLGLRLPRRQLGAMLGRLPLETLLGARFNLGAGFGKLRQTFLPARQLIGDRHAVRNIGLIRDRKS